MVNRNKIDSISLDGGILCLDYVNSVHDRRQQPLDDYLSSVQDLIAWSEKVRSVETKILRHLQRLTVKSPLKGRSFFREAIELRELLYRIFFSVAGNEKINSSDLALFNGFLKSHSSHLALVYTGKVFKEKWDFPEDSLHQLTAPIVKSAHGLLLSEKLHRIKECPSCGWLFLDTTKNGTRRWCSMKNCGSTVKALDWYYRKKAAR